MKTLSDKIWYTDTPNIDVKDVKDFIKQLKDFVNNEAVGKGSVLKEIDKLAGEKLIK